MVQGHDKDAVLGVHGEQPGAQRDLALQIEGNAVRGRRLTGGHHAQQRTRNPLRRQNALVSFRGGRHDRAQRLVPFHDVAQRQFQGVSVQRTAQAQSHRQMVGGARVAQALQEPQTLLPERQRDPLGAWDECRHRTPGRARLAQCGHQPGRGGRGEEGTDRNFHAELTADPADQQHRQQGVPAQGEEVVVPADPSHPQARGGEHRAHPGLLSGARCAAVGGRRSPGPAGSSFTAGAFNPHRCLRGWYPVLDPVSRACPRVKGRLPTCYSPVRH
ncbi:hypothetical protein SCANM63S_07592 [Streptomyces canarius]